MTRAGGFVVLVATLISIVLFQREPVTAQPAEALQKASTPQSFKCSETRAPQWTCRSAAGATYLQ